MTNWISVEERLPEERNEVLTYFKNNLDINNYWIGYCEGSVFRCPVTNCVIPALYWAELEPPK